MGDEPPIIQPVAQRYTTELSLFLYVTGITYILCAVATLYARGTGKQMRIIILSKSSATTWDVETRIVE
jgi:hypothetical protein